jgi:hypothetical protein
MIRRAQRTSGRNVGPVLKKDKLLGRRVEEPYLRGREDGQGHRVR